MNSKLMAFDCGFSNRFSLLFWKRFIVWFSFRMLKLLLISIHQLHSCHINMRKRKKNSPRNFNWSIDATQRFLLIWFSSFLQSITSLSLSLLQIDFFPSSTLWQTISSEINDFAMIDSNNITKIWFVTSGEEIQKTFDVQ